MSRIISIAFKFSGEVVMDLCNGPEITLSTTAVQPCWFLGYPLAKLILNNKTYI